MGLSIRLCSYLLNLRVVLGAILIFIALGVTPAWFDVITNRINEGILRLSIDFITLPQPETSVAIIHVPDIEYDAWLADMAGARSFFEVVKKAQSGGATVGILADEPIRFIQGRADKLINYWAGQSISSQKLRQQIEQHRDERQALIAAFEEDIVIGMPGRGSEQGSEIIMLPISWPWVPSWFTRYFWSPSKARSDFDLSSAAVEHFPAPQTHAVEQALVLNGHRQYRESFLMKLLRQGFASGNTEVQWSQGKGVRIGGKDLPLSYNGQLVPLYGEHTRIKSSTVQLTLDASKRIESLNDWVLVGRNESPALAVSAQSLMAIGDGAYLIVPVYFPVVKLVSIVLMLLLGVVGVLRARWLILLLSGISFIVIGVVLQILFASLLGFWLPMAGVYLALVITAIMLFICRMKETQVAALTEERQGWALAAAKLYCLKGEYLQAREAIARTPIYPKMLRWYYRIAKALEEEGYPDKALKMWIDLPRRYYRFRDIQERIRSCNRMVVPSATRPQSITPPFVDNTQVVAAASVSLESLGRYEVRQVLGHGGSGVVYRGFDPVISRDVALKTLNLNVFSSTNRERVKERFLAEVQTVGRLSHPNIVTVYDVGEQANWAYIAMDLAKGKPLTDYVQLGQLLPVPEVYWIGLKVAEALTFAHQQNVVHCDIKPGNIIYDRDSAEVKVTDFGIAKWLDEAHTETGEIMGSPLYMAPEQLQGHPVVAQTDIFSLGATLYQLLSGQAPFNGRNVAEIQQFVLHAQPASIRSLDDKLPASAARIVNRALKKRTTDRFSSASDMAFTLNKAIIRDFKELAKEWRLL